MKNNKYIFYLLAVIILIGTWYFYNKVPGFNNERSKTYKKVKSSSSPKSIKAKKERSEYFITLLRDPKTGKVPPGIRQKELEFAKILFNKSKSLKKTYEQFLWKEAGPYDVGGRTRALAVDITNPNIIIAGGISGGIWKSTDHGNSWKLKNISTSILSVTSIAQDPRPGFTNVWYYSTGEFTGNSARDHGSTALFSGNGVYKSIDNGETWSVLPSTISSDLTNWDSEFDFTSKIIVNPATGSIFVAANAFGILRSNDGGNSFTNVLGGLNEHIYSEIDIAKNGTIIATVSSPFNGYTSKNKPGIYKSVDDGAAWTNITPQDYPSVFYRSVICIAPSNPNTAYILLNSGERLGNKESNKFYKINIANGTAENRSSNLPDFNFNNEDYINTQGTYNMVIGVKPDDENLVLIGASSLFRSFDGFNTEPSNSKTGWIGGYANNQSQRYPNLHPDVHSFAFDPTDPKKVWCGNDGGLSYVSDITNTSYSDFIPWESKNNGYNVTQFYSVSISDEANDNRIMGGCQDNGTPFFTFDGNITSQSDDVSSGDGAYSYFGKDFAYTSSQQGWVNRISYNQSGNPSFSAGWSVIKPLNVGNQLFIHPFAVDPNDENVMYYPAANVMWRNNQLSSIPNYQQNGTSVGWAKLPNFNVALGYNITALAVSRNPAHILYFGASSMQAKPKLMKLQNANTSTGNAEVLNLPDLPSGAYIHNIAINPDDADEIIVVLSNYNILSIYYSADGGNTFTAADGNLEGTEQNPGPSIRAATILPTESGKVYMIATSIGIFSTGQLNGVNTTWIQENSAGTGNVVVNYITSRKSDRKVIAATHGRGAFIGTVSGGSGTAVLNLNVQQLAIGVKPDQVSTVPFTISNSGGENLNYSISVTQPAALTTKLEKTAGKIFNSKSNWGFRQELESLNMNLFNIAAIDSLYNDDGNHAPDDFFGNSGTFYWLSSFKPAEDFSLDGVRFYMRTETSNNNPLYFSVNEIADGQLSEPLYETQLTGITSQNGAWLEFQLPQKINFTSGKTIAIIIGALNTISFPAGMDYNGSKPGNSYYYDAQSNSWISFQGNDLANAAWLVRIFTEDGNQSERLTVNPASGVVAPNASENIQVSFNAQGLPEGNYQGQLKITSNGGSANVNVVIMVSNTIQDVDQDPVERNGNIPTDYSLLQNYPNPFNPNTIIKYSLPYDSHVLIRIYNINGERVKEILNRSQSAGFHNVSFNAENMSSGVYIYSVEAVSLTNSSRFRESKKMVYLK